jgi:AraC family transcriptional regulator, alkane utilization regulator
MDALSDVLKSMRLEGAAYLNAEFTAPWCVQAKFGLASVRARLAGAEYVMFFHFLAEGACKLRLADGHQAIDVAAGDLVLFLNEDQHLLGSDLHLAPVETGTLIRADAAEDSEVIQMRHGGGGTATRIVCGYVACSRGVCRPLLDALPRVLHIPIGGGPASPLLRELLRAGVHESAASRPGAESMLAKLAELMFVQAIRRYVETLPPERRGWLAGVRDPQIGRALALLHGKPGEAWSVNQLGRQVGLSRSALAERFTTLVGESPMQYLMRWRLALAARSLRSSGDPVSRVAKRSGYDSETAFNRAFKREFGMPPAAWRKAGPR